MHGTSAAYLSINKTFQEIKPISETGFLSFHCKNGQSGTKIIEEQERDPKKTRFC